MAMTTNNSISVKPSDLLTADLLKLVAHEATSRNPGTIITDLIKMARRGFLTTAASNNEIASFAAVR
jgi:hypothetical protein